VNTSKTAPYPDPRRPVLVRADEAERLDSIGHVLLADSSTTQGALSSHRVALARGADGAAPHRHDKASELFFILSGELDVLTGDEVITTAAGDLLVVPPGLAHESR
jgi:mannose-6-phosphate isomerase-like protein (cupin superfamily)